MPIRVAQSYYNDAMINYDKIVGQIIDLVDEPGIADNTFVIYCADIGPHRNTWPDAGTTKKNKDLAESSFTSPVMAI